MTFFPWRKEDTCVPYNSTTSTLELLTMQTSLFRSFILGSPSFVAHISQRKVAKKQKSAALLWAFAKPAYVHCTCTVRNEGQYLSRRLKNLRKGFRKANITPNIEKRCPGLIESVLLSRFFNLCRRYWSSSPTPFLPKSGIFPTTVAKCVFSPLLFLRRRRNISGQGEGGCCQETSAVYDSDFKTTIQNLILRRNSPPPLPICNQMSILFCVNEHWTFNDLWAIAISFNWPLPWRTKYLSKRKSTGLHQLFSLLPSRFSRFTKIRYLFSRIKSKKNHFVPNLQSQKTPLFIFFFVVRMFRNFYSIFMHTVCTEIPINESSDRCRENSVTTIPTLLKHTNHRKRKKAKEKDAKVEMERWQQQRKSPPWS